MYCPLCGNELTKIDRAAQTEGWDDDDPRWDEHEKDKSIWWKCIGCNKFGDDFPLQQHHPIYGINSRPGDSWSLSWIK